MVATEAAAESIATETSSRTLKPRPISIPMNNVATMKYSIVPNRTVVKPTGIQSSDGSLATFKSCFMVSSASGMQTSALQVAAPSITGLSRLDSHDARRQPQRNRHNQHRSGEHQPADRENGARKHQEYRINLRADQGDLRSDQSDDSDRQQETEPVKYHDADGLNVLQRSEYRAPRLTLGHHHADPENCSENQNLHAVVVGQRCKDVGRNESEQPAFRRGRGRAAAREVQRKLKVDPVRRTSYEGTDAGKRRLVGGQDMKNRQGNEDCNRGHRDDENHRPDRRQLHHASNRTAGHG